MSWAWRLSGFCDLKTYEHSSIGVAMRRIFGLLFGMLSATVIGCGPTPDPPVDKTVALEQLKLVLQSWKAAEPHASLEQRSPPVVFNEPLWIEGNTLLEYEIGDVELFGRQGRCTVKLFLQSKDGKRFERKLGYQIDTTPSTTIVREALGP